ncbi:MAG: Energy-coupling factor transporter ATP-binding protein EcfA1 [Firmicutes bacterium ADurb.Bin300]|jgi:energy-coupling factor transport system ATP-binding protein|nr:MAG: Energy-coupling factor transporter ATP-binding protein EcfA1 [Firmicutes bacterium ADurb.Bin300]
MEKDVIIKFDRVSYSYEEGGDYAVNDVNLDIYKGEFTAVLGHNGSGKSTLAKLTNALLLPVAGSVFVRGMDTAREEFETQIRQSVGMVFQNPDNQIVSTIVEDDVAFGPENLGVPPEEIRRRVDDALKTVGMYEYKGHEPHRLSGGQKQRVAIAGVIAMRTECIVFDEPTAMLDPKGRQEVFRAIKSLNKDFNITVILITHFMDEAVFADRVIVMDDGYVRLDGSPREVFKRVKSLRDMGLDVPKPLQLALLLKKEGIDLGDEILTNEDFIKEFLNYSGRNNVNT